MATLAPKAAKPLAMPRPMPEPPPVTTATRSVSKMDDGSIGTTGQYSSDDVVLERAPPGRARGAVGGLCAQDRAHSVGPDGARAAPDHRRGSRGGGVGDP